jgi:hypothetical protein
MSARRKMGREGLSATRNPLRTDTASPPGLDFVGEGLLLRKLRGPAGASGFRGGTSPSQAADRGRERPGALETFFKPDGSRNIRIIFQDVKSGPGQKHCPIYCSWHSAMLTASPPRDNANIDGYVSIDRFVATGCDELRLRRCIKSKSSSALAPGLEIYCGRRQIRSISMRAS